MSGGATIITFAADNDLFRKRRRVYRACAECKKRRKRCTHTFTESVPTTQERIDGDGIEAQKAEPKTKKARHSTGTISEDASRRSNGDRRPEQPRRATSAITVEDYAARTESPPRFVGDLQPEAVFLRERGNIPIGNECGHWERPPGPAAGPPSGEDFQQLKPSAMGDLTATEQEALNAYLATFKVDLLPPPEHLDALLSIYFSAIHPILPIVDKEELERSRPTALLQAICLIASKHTKARPHLTFGDDTLLTPREFTKRLYKSITTALSVKLPKSKVLEIQILALLAIHAEGPHGQEQASLHLAQAIHHAHSIGMQFGTDRSDSKAGYTTSLFWCLWSLDKLNCATNGRPLLMHDQDNRLETPTSDPAFRRTAFGIWLQLAEAMDHVIIYYRPKSDPTATGWEEGFPNFEEMLGEEGSALDEPTLATLELFYHCVAMWAYRARSINDPIPSTPSYVRQGLAAVRTIAILSKECPEDLPPLPVVPYAVSLATAVSYRAFRQTKLASHRKRSKEDLQACCKILGGMRDSWWSAGAMADLGTAALKKAEGGSTRKGSVAPGSSQENTSNVNGNASSRTPGPWPSGTTEIAQTPGMVTAQPATPFMTNDPLTTVNPNGVQLDTSSFSGYLNNSPDWLNFDNAFENMDMLLGSSGADLSMELLRPFSYDAWAFQGAPG